MDQKTYHEFLHCIFCYALVDHGLFGIPFDNIVQSLVDLNPLVWEQVVKLNWQPTLARVVVEVNYEVTTVVLMILNSFCLLL